jgi:hypothetical protein
MTPWRRAGCEVRALPRSLYRRSSVGASVRTLSDWVPHGVQPATKRISRLGLLDPAPLLLAMAPDVIGVRHSLLTTRSLMSCLEFEIAHRLRVQGRTSSQVALMLVQQKPDQDRELAGGCHRRDVLTAPAARLEEEDPQGTESPCGRPGASTSMPRARGPGLAW